MNPPSTAVGQSFPWSAYPRSVHPQTEPQSWPSDGFSGARLWRVAAAGGAFALRQWPSGHPTAARLRWMHGHLAHAARTSGVPLAVPVPTLTHETFLSHGGRLWELAPWLPGKAVAPAELDLRRVQAACTAVAQLHLALATGPDRVLELRPPPGLVQRRDRLERLLSGELNQWQRSPAAAAWPELSGLFERWSAAFVRQAPGLARELAATAEQRVALQPCLRDVWHAHVLFVGLRVSGIIDWGSLRTDHIAADLSRLLGSWTEPGSAFWQAGLAAYRMVRPLTVVDQQLLTSYHRAAVLLTPSVWFEWIYVDRRTFTDRAAVLARLTQQVERTEAGT